MKVVKIGENIFMDLHNLEEILPKLREFKKKFQIDIKLSLGGPLELEYNEERYLVDSSGDEIQFIDSRSKNCLLVLIEYREKISFYLLDGTLMFEINKL